MSSSDDSDSDQQRRVNGLDRCRLRVQAGFVRLDVERQLLEQAWRRFVGASWKYQPEHVDDDIVAGREEQERMVCKLPIWLNELRS